MTVVQKAVLRRNLAYADYLDTQAAGPFVGLHLGEAGKVHIRRTAPTGYIETEDAPAADDPGWIFASLPHLQDCLRYMETESIDMLRMSGGHLVLRTVDTPYESELRVHVVGRTHSGHKYHIPGDVYRTTEVEWLRGLNIKPFTLAAPPIIQGTHVVLSTVNGTVVWDTEIDPDLPSSPRDTFLKAVSDVSSGAFFLTERGYFAVVFNGMVFCIAGHQTRISHPLPSVQGATKLTDIRATRLVTALRSAAGLAAQGAPITVTPRGGVVTRNAYGQPVRFGLGETSAFMPFDLYERTARTVADALDQTPGDEATLYRMPSAQDRLLFTRGNCLVAVTGSPSPA